MSDWLKLDGKGRALNMALVLDVEPIEGGVILRWVNYGPIAYQGTDAARILAWVRAHGDLPQLAP